MVFQKGNKIWIGRKQTKKHIDNIVDTRRKNGSYFPKKKTRQKLKKNHWTINGKWTREEIKSKLSKYRKGKTYEEIYGKNKAKKIKKKMGDSKKGDKNPMKNPENVKKVLKAINKFNTSIEKKITKELKKLNIDYIHQFNFYSKYLCDFAIPNKKTIIECDGDYWHSLPKTKIKDKRKDKFIIKKGWKIIRLKEKDINNNIQKCIDKMVNVV